MCSLVLPIDIPPSERTRLCRSASEDVCSHSAHHVRYAAEVSSEDAAAEPYVRAVYIYQACTVTAERVSIASGEECSSYLRNILRACVANCAASTCAPCWLTVMLGDTCILQHAVFAMMADSPVPHSWTTAIAVQPSGVPLQPGIARWSLCAEPAPCRAVLDGNVHTPPSAALAEASSAPPQEISPVQREPPQSQRPAQGLEASSLSTAHSDTPAHVHSASMVAESTEAISRQPQAQQPVCADPRPRGAGPYTPRKASTALPTATSRRSSQSTHPNAPPPQSNCVMVYDSPQADLVAPSDGRQWGDLACRTRYSPRREELWELADTVMTHNYVEAMFSSGGKPAYIESYPHNRMGTA
ncbi:hypothetical protein ABL78_8112 [Leptomonas seymouri]|uniref:Uncharacterized protein n=1 Tax=Leptomonas seymouri TaxID=5684 RepID=A0A0N0P2F1_LEPSE|nr:hypothetical protein ABL78_8112 [Leptomonas seymouri]|eukprot:KPI82879.1 hypothetical protein ABL78_8112 [Leptomonas seymouri]